MPSVKLLTEIVEIGTRLVSARYGALGKLNARGDALEQVLTAGTAPAIPPSLGLLSPIIREPRPLRLKDVSLDLSLAGFSRIRLKARSYLAVPLFHRRALKGGLCFLEKQGAPEFRAADERLAESLARLAMRTLESETDQTGIRQVLRFFRTAAEEKDDAVIIMSPSREILSWNDGARKLFGYSAEEVLGLSFLDLLVPPEGRARWSRHTEPRLARELREGKTVHYDTMRLRKDGTRIPVSATLSPVHHEMAGVNLVTGIHRSKKA